jgi:hypothetical protein
MGKKKKKDTDDDPLSLSSSSITSTSHLWKKRSSSSATNANADPSVLLHIPGRLTTNGATKLGCLYTQQGKKGTNQDAMLFWEVPSSHLSYYYPLFFFLNLNCYFLVFLFLFFSLN